MMTEEVKDAIHNHWNKMPEWFQAGERLDDFEKYSLEYFEKGSKLRYLPERFQCILDFVDFSKFKDRLVIEIGTGQGFDLVEFARAGAFVIGADLSIRNCLVTKKRLETYGLNGHFLTLDAECIPLAAESVDDVYSFGVLHHAPGMYDAFKEVERILKPGGTVTMMLYRKGFSLWKWQCTYLGWFFMQTVKRDAWKRLYRRMGEAIRIKSFLSDEFLDQYQARARERKHSLEEICAFMTDGPNNPLSLFVDRKDIIRGFPNLKPERFYNCYLGPVPVMNKMLPAGFRRFVARKLGGFIFSRLRKPLREKEHRQPRQQNLSNKEFQSLLVDPIEKRPLDWDGEYLKAQNGDRYPVVRGIPLLRPENRITD